MTGFAFLTAHSCQCIQTEMEQGSERGKSQKATAEAQIKDGDGLDQNDGVEQEEK